METSVYACLGDEVYEFKSYYVVWKLATAFFGLFAWEGLNRTM